MSYWIDLAVPEPPKPYYEVKDYSVHCTWNFYKLMSHLPCGWVKFWNEKKAEELIGPITNSIKELKVSRSDYVEYAVYHENSSGINQVDACCEMLYRCLVNFREAPELRIIVA